MAVEAEINTFYPDLIDQKESTLLGRYFLNNKGPNTVRAMLLGAPYFDHSRDPARELTRLQTLFVDDLFRAEFQADDLGEDGLDVFNFLDDRGRERWKRLYRMTVDVLGTLTLDDTRSQLFPKQQVDFCIRKNPRLFPGVITELAGIQIIGDQYRKFKYPDCFVVNPEGVVDFFDFNSIVIMAYVAQRAKALKKTSSNPAATKVLDRALKMLVSQSIQQPLATNGQLITEQTKLYFVSLKDVTAFERKLVLEHFSGCESLGVLDPRKPALATIGLLSGHIQQAPEWRSYFNHPLTKLKI